MALQLPDLDNECFFIAPIGGEGTPERKRSDGVLEFIVARAAEELELTAVRADQIAEPGQITLQVIEHVLGARAAVVDLTGLNPNVFYEMAVRHTARLPVALIADKGCSLPFDIAQMRTIFFDHTDLKSADECRRAIVSHLREALTSGAVDSPIATTIDVRTLQSGSVVERNIADLVTSVEELAKAQRAMFLEIGRERRPDFSHPAFEDLLSGLDQLQFIDSESSDQAIHETVRALQPALSWLERQVVRHGGRSGRIRREQGQRHSLEVRERASTEPPSSEPDDLQQGLGRDG